MLDKFQVIIVHSSELINEVASHVLFNFINSIDSIRFGIAKRFRPYRSTSCARFFPIYIAHIFDLNIIRYSINLAEKGLEWGDLEFIKSWADIVGNLVNLIVVS